MQSDAAVASTGHRRRPRPRRCDFEGVAAANLTRRHRVALAALQTYSISRQLVRQDAHEGLLPHVAEMKRLNRFGRRRARKSGPGQPAPLPQQPPVA